MRERVREARELNNNDTTMEHRLLHLHRISQLSRSRWQQKNSLFAKLPHMGDPVTRQTRTHFLSSTHELAQQRGQAKTLTKKREPTAATSCGFKALCSYPTQKFQSRSRYPKRRGTHNLAEKLENRRDLPEGIYGTAAQKVYDCTTQSRDYAPSVKRQPISAPQ